MKKDMKKNLNNAMDDSDLDTVVGGISKGYGSGSNNVVPGNGTGTNGQVPGATGIGTNGQVPGGGEGTNGLQPGNRGFTL